MSHPTKPTDIGKNRTGIATSPVDARALVEEAKAFTPAGQDGAEILRVRTELGRIAEPVGTMPPPASLKGAVKTAIDTLKGKTPTVLLDKIGERLAFERTGTRLYEALLAKLAASDQQDPSLTQTALEEIRQQELEHFGILCKAMETLGADPTAMTPCADVASVAASGLIQVVSDPRSTFTQCLGMALTAELTDNASWELLCDLCEGLGHDELAAQFRQCMAQEEVHLERVRGWLATSVTGQAGLEAPAEEAPAAVPPA